MKVNELDGTVVPAGTRIRNLVKAHDLTRVAFVFWQVLATSILPQAGHLRELSSYAMFTSWRIFLV